MHDREELFGEKKSLVIPGEADYMVVGIGEDE